VHRAWLRAEAASPVQHSELSLPGRFHQWSPDPMDISRLRWELRDASCLLGLDLGYDSVSKYLTLQPMLTRLERLTLMNWDYKYGQAEQLLCTQSLKNLQVCHLLSCLPKYS